MIEMFIKREQSIFETKEPIQNDMKQLNLVKHHNEVYQCQGRIQGDYPIYIPRNIGSKRPVSEADSGRRLGGGGGRGARTPLFWAITLKNYKLCYLKLN